MKPARNIIELCKSLIYRHSLERVGEVVLAVFFIGECNFDSMGVDLSGRNGQANYLTGKALHQPPFQNKNP